MGRAILAAAAVAGKKLPAPQSVMVAEDGKAALCLRVDEEFPEVRVAEVQRTAECGCFGSSTEKGGQEEWNSARFQFQQGDVVLKARVDLAFSEEGDQILAIYLQKQRNTLVGVARVHVCRIPQKGILLVEEFSAICVNAISKEEVRVQGSMSWRLLNESANSGVLRDSEEMSVSTPNWQDRLDLLESVRRRIDELKMDLENAKAAEKEHRKLLDEVSADIERLKSTSSSSQLFSRNRRNHRSLTQGNIFDSTLFVKKNIPRTSQSRKPSIAIAEPRDSSFSKASYPIKDLLQGRPLEEMKSRRNYLWEGLLKVVDQRNEASTKIYQLAFIEQQLIALLKFKTDHDDDSSLFEQHELSIDMLKRKHIEILQEASNEEYAGENPFILPDNSTIPAHIICLQCQRTLTL